MKLVLALLCGWCFFGGILNANNTMRENVQLENTNATKPLLQGMKSDSNLSEFSFEMGKSPLESVNMLQYFGVILILVGLLLFLWYVKSRLNTPRIKYSKANVWSAFFEKENLPSAVQVQSVTTLGLNSKLVVFEAYKKRYLVVLNANNTTLVDVYNVNSSQENKGQESFKELLEQESPSEAK